MDLATLEPGSELFSRRIAMTGDAVAGYLAAVEDDAEAYAQEGIVPPMAVAALVMCEALKAIELPAGAVHTGQELGFQAAVEVGTDVDCSAKVVQNSVRRGTRFMALEITADVGDARALTGWVSLAIPDGSEGGE
jgi:acyl dehydratase